MKPANLIMKYSIGYQDRSIKYGKFAPSMQDTVPPASSTICSKGHCKSHYNYKTITINRNMRKLLKGSLKYMLIILKNKII